MPTPPLMIYARTPPSGGKAAQLAAARRGNERAVAAEAARLFTLTPVDDPGPRVVTKLADVTAGLGLEATVASRVQSAVGSTNQTYSKHGGSEHRIGIQRGALMQVIRTDDVPVGARAEIIARATSWWKQTARTDYGDPTGASAVSKSLTISVPILTLGEP